MTGILLASEGELVTCTKGHEIALLASDFHQGDMLTPGLLQWQTRNPDPGHDDQGRALEPKRQINRCPTCGERFVATDAQGRVTLCIDGSWRGQAPVQARETPHHGDRR